MKKMAMAGALAASVLAGCSMMGSGGGWTTLVDGGKGLENFDRIGDANWRAEGGALVADKAKETSYLVTRKSYRNFEIHAEFWSDKNTNSGIFVRAQNPKKIGADSSYEVNIYDARPGQEYSTAAIVDFARIPVPAPYKAAGKWNTFHITAKDNHVTVVFNGVKTVDMRNDKFREGPFALQFGNHGKAPGDVIKWRKVQVREL
jgi:hypothetical protein